MQRVDVRSCHFGVSPSKNPDVAAGHGPATSFNPGWNRLVSGVGALIRNFAAQWGEEAKQVSWEYEKDRLEFKYALRAVLRLHEQCPENKVEEEIRSSSPNDSAGCFAATNARREPGVESTRQT